MLRLGAAQVKQVAHPAPNENPSRPPAVAGRDVATPIYDVRRLYAAERGFAGVSLHFIVSIVSCRAHSIMWGPSPLTVWHSSHPCSFHRHVIVRFFRHPIISRFRAAFGARIISFPCADPARGGRRSAARRTLGLRSRWRGAMPRWRHAAIPLRPGSRPSALHRGDFRPRDHASTPAVFHRIHVATCPPARSQDLADWVPYLPRRGSLPSATGRHASLRLQDRLRRRPLHERERIWCSIDALRSQYQSWNVVTPDRAIFVHSAKRRSLRTGEVAGSIPAAPAIFARFFSDSGDAP
jgi:hypothetical protein